MRSRCMLHARCITVAALAAVHPKLSSGDGPAKTVCGQDVGAAYLKDVIRWDGGVFFWSAEPLMWLIIQLEPAGSLGHLAIICKPSRMSVKHHFQQYTSGFLPA